VLTVSMVSNSAFSLTTFTGEVSRRSTYVVSAATERCSRYSLASGRPCANTRMVGNLVMACNWHNVAVS